jgi:putative hemolysin
MKGTDFCFYALIVAYSLLPACETGKPGKPGSRVANPASVHCIEQGGTLEIRTEPGGGQAGICVFDDGSECEEWALFRGECAKGGSGK